VAVLSVASVDSQRVALTPRAERLPLQQAAAFEQAVVLAKILDKKTTIKKIE
jgi:hypothetical protein